MEKISKVILSNMCLIYDNNGHILVIERTKNDWPGINLPGGHVEENETIDEAVVREIKEETGLTIKNPKLCAIKEWPWGENLRYLGLLYKCNEFEGEIKSSDEGKVFRIKRSDLNKYKLSQDLDELISLIENAKL